jgi:hypothetical protein
LNGDLDAQCRASQKGISVAYSSLHAQSGCLLIARLPRLLWLWGLVIRGPALPGGACNLNHVNPITGYGENHQNVENSLLCPQFEWPEFAGKSENCYRMHINYLYTSVKILFQ